MDAGFFADHGIFLTFMLLTIVTLMFNIYQLKRNFKQEQHKVSTLTQENILLRMECDKLEHTKSTIAKHTFFDIQGD